MEYGHPSLPRRFWNKVEVDASGCWLWLAYCDDDGYARFSVQVRPGKSRSVLAHRWCYCVANGYDYFGAALRGIDLHHTRCVGRHCVHASHLHEAEKVRHGYHHGKMRHYSEELCSGSAHCMCYRCCEEEAVLGQAGNEEVPF